MTRQELMDEIARVRALDVKVQEVSELLAQMTHDAYENGEELWLVDAARRLGLRVETSWSGAQPPGTLLVLGGPEPFALIHPLG